MQQFVLNLFMQSLGLAVSVLTDAFVAKYLGVRCSRAVIFSLEEMIDVST